MDFRKLINRYINRHNGVKNNIIRENDNLKNEANIKTITTITKITTNEVGNKTIKEKHCCCANSI